LPWSYYNSPTSRLAVAFRSSVSGGCGFSGGDDQQAWKTASTQFGASFFKVRVTALPEGGAPAGASGDFMSGGKGGGSGFSLGAVGGFPCDWPLTALEV